MLIAVLVFVLLIRGSAVPVQTAGFMLGVIILVSENEGYIIVTLLAFSRDIILMAIFQKRKERS